METKADPIAGKPTALVDHEQPTDSYRLQCLVHIQTYFEYTFGSTVSAVSLNARAPTSETGW